MTKLKTLFIYYVRINVSTLCFSTFPHINGVVSMLHCVIVILSLQLFGDQIKGDDILFQYVRLYTSE